MLKGIVLHIVGKLSFILGGYIMQYFLMHSMPPEVYGLVGVITMVINFNYLFLNNGMRQAISNLIAKDRYNPKDVTGKGMLFQGIIILMVFSVNFFGASWLATMLRDTSLTPYIRSAAFIIPFMGIYFAALGVLNGFKLFVAEACIVTIYPLLKLVVIPFVMVMEDSIHATEMSFLFAGVVICVVSLLVLLKKNALFVSDKPKVPYSEYIKGAVGFSVVFSVASIVMSLDTGILKMLEVGDDVVGYYTAAVTIGKVPYYLLSAFFLVVLPVVTRYYVKNAMERAAEVIRDLLTVILAMVLPVVVIISASSRELLLAYCPDESYSAASWALSFLLFGTFFLGLTLVFSMIISAVNKKNFSTGLSLGMLVGYAVCCYAFSSFWGISGAGLASLTVCLITAVVAFLYMRKLFDGLVKKNHLVLVCVNGGLFVLTRLFFTFVSAPNLILVLFVYAMLYVGLLGGLVVTKTLSLRQIAAMFKKDREDIVQAQSPEQKGGVNES